MPGVISGDCSKQRGGNLCGVDQPRPSAYADRDTAAVIGVEGGAISEG